MNKYILTIIFLSIGFFAQFQATAAIDSLRVETIDGKKFIVHKVEPKETLYALSRRYQVSVDDILTSNEEVKDGYAIDQIGRILFIPLKIDVQSTKVAAPATIHTVKAGETLYGLARQYEVSVADIKKWNDLTSNQLDLGQELKVGRESAKVKANTEVATKTNDAGNDKQSKDLVHTVTAGQTIYAIAKQYDVTQEAIKVWNNLESNEISIGQKLVIRKKLKNNSDEGVVMAQKVVKQQSGVQKTYVASKGERYADVAEKFDIFLGDLEAWNNFKEPFVGGEVIKLVAGPNAGTKPDQKTVKINTSDKEMHVVASGETIYSLADDYGVDMEDLRKWNDLENYQLSVGQKLFVKNPDAFDVDTQVVQEVREEQQQTAVVDIIKEADTNPKQDTKAYFSVEEEDIPKLEKVVETGIAEVIAGSDNTEKYLALHRTAKIGTIMQVRNDLNDQIVFVRILGKLPDNGVDAKVIIKISKKAFQKLGGVDYKFPVEISYLPLND